MWKRFAPRLRKTIVFALGHAGRFGLDRGGVDHLLLAMARDEESAAAMMLAYCGIDAAKLAAAIESQRSSVASMQASAESLDDDAIALLNCATTVADVRRDKHVGTEHVLIAAIENRIGAIRGMNLDPKTAREALDHWITSGMPRRRFGPQPLRVRSPIARKILKPIHKVTQAGSTLYRVFAQLSLGHPRFASDPYPFYRRLRQKYPLRKDPIAPVWVALRYDDVVSVLRDPRFKKEPFISDALPDAARRQFGLPEARDAAVEGEPLAMLFLDPPRHTRIRAVFNKAFVPRTLNALRPRIQQIADGQIDAGERRGAMDVIQDLAVPLPIKVIAELVGFPPDDYERLKKWSDDFAAALTINPTAEKQERSNQSREEMRGYFEQIVANLRAKPQENLICTLLAANENGRLLSPMELFANCTLLMAAGHETTTNLIGNGLLALLRNPDQMKLLRDNPELISSAVDELLRYDSPVQWIARVANEDLELRGQRIKRGDIVIGSLGSANRDPEVFDDPDRLDIKRKNGKHIAFGHGEHYCIGAMLARIEGEIAIGTVIRRFPKLRLNTRRVKWNRNIIFRGLKALRVQL
jgi:cytochrome P450